MAKYEIITNKLNTFFTNNKISVANTVPGSGNWRAGDIVYSSTPTSMCYGWMCIQSGTPGNWITLNNTDILPINDTRGENPKPKEFLVGRRTEFKSRESINNPSGGHTYTIIDTVKGWTDNSGGSTVQMSYGADKAGTKPMLSVRSGDNSAESWGSWYDLYHSGNKPTWNDIDGKPASFPVAAHNHDSVYLKANMHQISSGDFNNYYKESVIYSVSSSTTIANAPYNDNGLYGILIVVCRNSGGDAMQRFIDCYGKEFFRHRSGADNTWKPWVKVFSSSQKPTWDNITGKPSSFPPAAHNHDTVYYRTQMGNTTDFNLCLSTGIYYAKGGGIKNLPPGGGEYGILEVIVYNGNEVIQRYQDSVGRIFTRFRSYVDNGTWQQWVGVYTQANGPSASNVTLQDSSNLFNAADVEGAMKELFTNVDNGKSSIAQAIIAKGVSGASKDNTFGQLSDKIRQIPDVTRCRSNSSGACFLDPLDFRDELDGQENRLESDHSLRLEVYHDRPRSFKSFKLGMEGTMYCKLHGIKTATTTISVKSTENNAVLFTKALKTNVVTEFEFNVTKNSYIQIDITNHTNSQGAGIFLAINIWLRYEII